MIAQDIALWLTARAALVRTAGGYNTEVGRMVYRGRRRLDDDSPPCVVLAELEDVVTEQTQKGRVHLQQVYALEAHDVCDPDNPNDKCLEIVQDLKRAIFGAPTLPEHVRKIHYRGRTIGPRDEGNSLCFASIRIAVEYTEDLATG